MYYILSFNLVDEKKDLRLYGTIYDNQQNIVEEIFDNGKVLIEHDVKAPFTIILNEKNSRIKNKKQTDKICTSVIESGFLFLISPAAAAVFEKLKLDNLQYFDVTIRSSLIQIDDYKIVNITDKIDCTDFEASELKLYDDGDIKGITTLVLNEQKIPVGKKIFLLGRKATGVIIVQEDLMQSIKEAGLTGFQFIELDKAGQLY